MWGTRMGHRSPHKGDVSPRGLQEPASERSCRETGLDMRSRSKNQLHVWVIQASFMPLYLPACVPAKSLQSCPTLCDPVDPSPPGSSVSGTLQTRILGWVVMPSSRGSSQPSHWTCVSYVSCIDRQVLLPPETPEKPIWKYKNINLRMHLWIVISDFYLCNSR